MLPVLTALIAAALGVAMSGHTHAADLEVLPSRICQAPSYELFAADDRRQLDNGAPGSSDRAQWERAFQAVMARCKKGDILALTREAHNNALRYCAFDRPMHFLVPIGVVCTYAGGVREMR